MYGANRVMLDTKNIKGEYLNGIYNELANLLGIDDLNIISILYFLFSLTSSSATLFKQSCDSITQGPAIIIGNFICL